MGKLDELEHDTHEDASAPVPPGLSQPVTIEPPEPRTAAERQARVMKDRRREMKAERKMGDDEPWLSLNNPAIWTGDIGADDD